MTHTVVPTQLKPAEGKRLDVIAFFGSFAVGLLSYGVLSLVRAPKLLVLTAVVAVMCAYAFVAMRLPRLRVRLDQAGDNAYYLGLLFTLVSMAVALYQFGASQFGAATAAAQVGARQIIGDFGMALGTTIAGIFLRVLLHQMRVDPAELESVSRLELSDAASRVKATLNNVTAAMTRFQEELKQRTIDQLGHMVADIRTAVATLTEEVTKASRELLHATATAHREVVTATAAMGRAMGEAAEQSEAAAKRLSAINTPLESLGTQLANVSGGFVRLDKQVGGLAAGLGATRGAAAQMNEALAQAATNLTAATARAERGHEDAVRGVEDAARRLTEVLSAVGATLEEDRRRLSTLEDQTHRSAAAVQEVEENAEAVLRGLTEAVKTFTKTVRSLQ